MRHCSNAHWDKHCISVHIYEMCLGKLQQKWSLAKWTQGVTWSTDMWAPSILHIILIPKAPIWEICHGWVPLQKNTVKKSGKRFPSLRKLAKCNQPPAAPSCNLMVQDLPLTQKIFIQPIKRVNAVTQDSSHTLMKSTWTLLQASPHLHFLLRYSF